MNSEGYFKHSQSNKENGINAHSLQSKDKNTISKQNGDEMPKHQVVVEKKRKKEVIQISSSESEPANRIKETHVPLKQTQNWQRADKTKKIKKTAFKCQLCKVTGKKSQMKACMNCRYNFHTSCIQNQVGVPKRFICQKCRFQKMQQLRQQQHRLIMEQQQMTLQLEKLVPPKKTQKQKKKQEYTKRLNQFSARYPYYVQEDQKFKYPIQDKLLIIYRQIFDTNEAAKPKPKNHPLIPSNMIADFLQIQNFFSTFKQQLQPALQNFPKDIRKNFLYIALNSEVIDEIFASMIYCLLKIYLSDIFDKNKTDNVKMLNENCFFTLLTNMNESQDLNEDIIVPAAQEIIRYLSTIPSMKKSFQDFVFPQKYNLENKVYILVSLIKGLSQIDTFHEFVAAKSQKMQNLTKQKGELVNQLKTDQAQNLSNKEKIKQFANVDLQLDQKLNKNDQFSSIASTRHITRQKDKNKKKIQKLTHQKDKSERNIQQIRAKISQISKTLPFVTSQVVFLGKDRNDTHYFFFCNQPNRIYCRYRNFLLDDGEDYYMYEGKQAITQLHKSLNLRGIHEKHLSDMISYFVKQSILYDKQSEQQEEDYTNVQPYLEGIYENIKRQDVMSMILQLEQTFSNYLAMKNLQWAEPVERENFLANMKIQTDIQQIKQMIINLQESFLFVEPVSQQFANNRRIQIIDSDEQDKNEKKEFKKKSPVRLWGINSERIKKYWVQYLEQCIDFKGIWICGNILKNYVDRYVKKKMEFLLQQQKKEEKIEKQKQRHRLRKERQQRQSQKHSRQRSRQERPSRRGRRPIRKIVQSQEQRPRSNRPNLRQRKKTRFQIDSDLQQQENQYSDEYQQQEEQEQQQSQNEDKCQICEQYGEMICCDTCPKVYHLECLKLKQIPDGQWSCFKCLQQMANQRQTRSRASQMKKPSTKR